MSKLAQRLLIFFIGVPAVIGIVLVQFMNHLPLNIVILAASVIACIEMHSMCGLKTSLLPKWLLIPLSALMPLSAYLFMILNINLDYIIWIFALCAVVLMAAECFFRKSFEDSIPRLSVSVFIVFYSGYLFTFIQRIGHFRNSTFFLSLFFFIVFIHDSLAWLFGVLFGKNNRGIFPASPNKSVAGCIGGIAGAVASCILAKIIWPEFLGGNFIKPVVLGILCALGAITGDLTESVFKRSAGVKDSGKVILGRGGMLDSVDSLLFTAPIFYIAVFFLFSPGFAG